MWGRAILVILMGLSTITTGQQSISTSSTVRVQVTTVSSVPAQSSTKAQQQQSTPQNNNNNNDQNLSVGRSINIFSRYGYLSLSMRVVPRNDSSNNPYWIFREPTVDIFKNIDNLIVDRKSTRNNKQRSKSTQLFDGDFHMEFCDNLRQLLQAYFRDFQIERLQKPWRAFSGSWTTDLIARNLGINSSFIASDGLMAGSTSTNTNGDHCYVLVRVSRFRQSFKLQQLPLNVEISEKVQEEMDTIKVGDSATVEEFIRKFGSHYISAYVTGNSMYQVFVYSRKVYARIKERLKSQGIGQLSTTELSNYFSPWYAEHMGQIKVASGNQTMEQWATTNLKIHYYIFTYASLLKLHGDTSLLKQLNNLLGNEALLQLDLKTLTPAFKNPKTRQFYQEVLDNYLKLWEVNM